MSLVELKLSYTSSVTNLSSNNRIMVQISENLSEVEVSCNEGINSNYRGTSLGFSIYDRR